jgi:TonB family protein
VKGNNIFNLHPLFVPVLLPFLILASFAVASDRANAQSPDEPTKPDNAAAIQARIERARALTAAHQLAAAANELESLRMTAQDDVVRNVTSIVLMSICLEEANYARAESLLEETFRSRSAKKDASIRSYFALAGQAVNGARSHLARYRSFGINVTDAGLPTEALNDLERLRSLLDRMIAQAREITREQGKAYESFALLEDVLGLRLSLARNDDDRVKLETEYADARRGLASSPTGIGGSGRSLEPESGEERSAEKLQSASPSTSSSIQSGNSGNVENANTLNFGALNGLAIRKVVSVYPQIAKAASAKGVVKVYVTVDESGGVIDISRSEGPPLLKGAAEDAARRWKFPPTEVAGKRVRVAGYIEFNFAP